MAWRYCRVRAWASNCIATVPTSLFLGDMVTGVLAAFYGGLMAAVLDTWKLTYMDEWALLAPYEVPLATTDFDIKLTFGQWKASLTSAEPPSFTNGTRN